VLEKWQRLYNKPTRAEQLLEPCVARLGVPYRFQHLVWHYVIDFALVAQKVAIECDGLEHKRKDRALKDAERTAWLKKHGWMVVRIDDQEIFENPAAALNRALEPFGLSVKE
jgi:very-short-patch-repair endonuclease